MKKLTVDRFDRMTDKMTAHIKPVRIIWTLPAIGRRIGVGVDFVRDTLAKQPGSPVKDIGGRYYAFEDDLIAYLRFKDCDDQTDNSDDDSRPT